MTTSISTIEAKEQFNDLLNRVSHRKERIILTRREHNIAALIPIDDLKLLLDSQDKHDLIDATEALTEARSQGCVSLDTLKEKLG